MLEVALCCLSIALAASGIVNLWAIARANRFGRQVLALQAREVAAKRDRSRRDALARVASATPIPGAPVTPRSG